MGLTVGRTIAVIDGLPSDTTRDQLKAMGAAAASSGAVALFHVAGVTPEASTVAAACGASTDSERVILEPAMLRSALDRLTTVRDIGPVDAVAVGSPHFSLDEFAQLARLVAGRGLTIPFYACTARDTFATLQELGIADELRRSGVEIVVDTCVVVTPILPARGGVLMTNSGKFAHYGPSNTGYEVVYGSLEDCVDSAIAGRVCRNDQVWTW